MDLFAPDCVREIKRLTGKVPSYNSPVSPENGASDKTELQVQGKFDFAIFVLSGLRSIAHALTSGLTLVTNNEKEFRRVRELKVQNWVI